MVEDGEDGHLIITIIIIIIIIIIIKDTYLE